MGWISPPSILVLCREMKFELFCLSLFILPLLTADIFINGGHKVKIKKYPFIARLKIPVKNNKMNGCTGSLVKNGFILTAYHCFLRDGELFPDGTATFNDSSRDKEEKNEFTVKMKLHKYYADSDLALAKLSRNVEAQGIPPVGISKKSVRPGSTITAVGYGMHGPSPRHDDGHLRHIDLSVSYVKGNWIGTKVGENKAGPCRGDSGGPMLVKESGGWSVVATLEGFGYDCYIDSVHPVYKDDKWSSVRVINPSDMKNPGSNRPRPYGYG